MILIGKGRSSRSGRWCLIAVTMVMVMVIAITSVRADHGSDDDDFVSMESEKWAQDNAKYEELFNRNHKDWFGVEDEDDEDDEDDDIFKVGDGDGGDDDALDPLRNEHYKNTGRKPHEEYEDE